MEDSQFAHLANTTLEDLSVIIEDADTNSILDIEYQDGVLTITLEDDKQFVINRHIASQKIWYSSPFTGASYYVYQENSKDWQESDGTVLHSLLADEFTKHVGITLPM